MESASCKEVKQEGGVKIYFAEKVFGKPTKNRREDPNMFELLSWDVEGFEKHSFKKDEKFHQSAEAYLNMIGKHPWKSEAQENYVDYHQHCIDANPDVLLKIENYIEERLPNSAKPERKSPSKPKPKDKKLTLPKEEEKKENRYQPNYLSPKAASSKLIPPDAVSPKQFHRSSSGDIAKSFKKIRSKEEDKVEPQQKHSNDSHTKQSSQKNYGQSLEREKLNDQEMSEHEQQKLIEHVLPFPLSSSKPPAGSPTVPSPPTSANRPLKTTAGATPSPSTEDSSTVPTSTPTTCTPTEAKTTPKTSSPTQLHS
jgi:hypothetical protein